MANGVQNRRGMLLVTITICLIVLGLGAYWVLKREAPTEKPRKKELVFKLPRMANLPSTKEKSNPLPEYPPNAPLLEKVRKAFRDGIDPAGALALSKSLPECPERADAAFLLLEYAAENGIVEAELAVGKFYDPSFNGPSGTIRKNPITAYHWYRKALEGGEKRAEVQLNNLRHWLKKQGDLGSTKSKALLDHWR